MALMFAICRPQPNWMPRKPKLMFQICQKLRCGFMIGKLSSLRSYIELTAGMHSLMYVPQPAQDRTDTRGHPLTNVDAAFAQLPCSLALELSKGSGGGPKIGR